MELISVGEVLSRPEKNPETWFYLPPNIDDWNLNTQGVFSLDSSDYSPDSDDYLPRQVKENGWVETIDGATIQDIVENAKEQQNHVELDHLFKAFIFYYENDSFIIF